ncbi:hypothetical protein [Lacinutrix undariae]
MKHIHFDNKKNWGWIIILILSLFFIVFGTFEFFEFENPKINKRISAVGFLLQTIYFTKMFWFKNYIQWNKIGITIKLHIVNSITLSFNDIRGCEIKEDTFIITKKDGEIVTFNIENVVIKDVIKLQQIIESHISS